PYLDSQIEAMTPTLEIFAIMEFNLGGTPIMRPIHLIGIDPEGRAKVGGFGEHLLLAKDKAHPTFDLSQEGYEHYLQRHPWANMKLFRQSKPLIPSDKPEPTP